MADQGPKGPWRADYPPPWVMEFCPTSGNEATCSCDIELHEDCPAVPVEVVPHSDYEKLREALTCEVLPEAAAIAASNELLAWLPPNSPLRGDTASREEIAENVVLAALGALTAEIRAALAATPEEEESA